MKDDEEIRVVDPVTQGAKGQKLARFELIPIGPLTELARLYGAGAAKYEDRNWERGFAWSLSYAAMMRHATQFWDGETNDPETQRHHLASVIFHAMALMEFEAKGKGTDDRPLMAYELVGPEVPSEEQVNRWKAALLKLQTSPPFVGRVPDPLGHDQPSEFPYERHIHHSNDHAADADNRDHKECVPCPVPKCNCHHPI